MLWCRLLLSFLRSERITKHLTANAYNRAPGIFSHKFLANQFFHSEFVIQYTLDGPLLFLSFVVSFFLLNWKPNVYACLLFIFVCASALLFLYSRKIWRTLIQSQHLLHTIQIGTYMTNVLCNCSRFALFLPANACILHMYTCELLLLLLFLLFIIASSILAYCFVFARAGRVLYTLYLYLLHYDCIVWGI